MKKEEKCPFCDIKEEKTRVLSETALSVTILSNPSLVRGHCLVIPKRHVEKLNELREDERKDLLHHTIKMQELLLKKFFGCDIRQNYRPFQKQNSLKVNHLHIHLQPRKLKDELYQKCQKFEKQIFRQINQKELDKLKEFILT